MRNPAAPVSRLTAAEQALLETMAEVVERAAGKAARRVGAAHHDDLKQLAWAAAAEAVGEFDGRGDIRGFVGQRVAWRLGDEVRRRRLEARVRSTVRVDVEDRANRGERVHEPSHSDDPGYAVRTREAADRTRRILSFEDLDSLRMRLDGVSVREIAKINRMRLQRTCDILRDSQSVIERKADERGVRAHDLFVELVLASDLRKRAAVFFRETNGGGYSIV